MRDYLYSWSFYSSHKFSPEFLLPNTEGFLLSNNKSNNKNSFFFSLYQFLAVLYVIDRLSLFSVFESGSGYVTQSGLKLWAILLPPIISFPSYPGNHHHPQTEKHLIVEAVVCHSVPHTTPFCPHLFACKCSLQ